MNVPQPTAMHAPTASYVVFYALFAAGMVGSVGWLAWRAWRSRSWLPLAAVAGGGVIGVVLPSLYDNLTLCWFPRNIPLPVITAYGMRDPLFDLLGYALYIGFGGWAVCELLRAGHGRRGIWLSFAFWGVLDLALELPFLHWGMYRYYGHQPFSVGGFPLYWVFMNGTVPVLSGVGMYVAVERWPFGTPGVWWRVAIVPSVAGVLLFVPVSPVAAALHADVAGWVRDGAAIISAAISLATVHWVAGQFAPATRPLPAPAAEPPVLASAR
jgi:hypothetical protein